MREKALKVIDPIIEYSLYSLIFFIPISKAAIEVFAGIAFISFIIKKIIKPDFRNLNSPLHLFLLLFVFFVSLSFINSGPLLEKSFKALFFKWLKYIGIFLFVQETFSQGQRLKKALAVVLFTSFIVGIDGLTQKFWRIELLKHGFSKVNLALGITASFNHYNDFSAYLVIILSVLLALSMLKSSRVIDRIAIIAMLILQSFCFIFTFSRGAWLGFSFSVALMLFLFSRARQLYLIPVIFLSILIFIPELRHRILFTFSEKGDADRFIVWQGAWRMIKEHPFLGVGLGTFMDNFYAYVSKKLFIQYAHNCYLQIWAETGIFSLLSFCAFLGLLLSKGIYVFKRNKDFLILGLVCGIFGFLVHSFFDTQFYSLQLSAFFWSMAGLLYASILKSSTVE